MNHSLKPLYLFADSQLLFWREPNGVLFLDRIRRDLPLNQPIAAYVGASNHDEPAYFQLFEAAMNAVDIQDCRMIRSQYDERDIENLATADLILLAGGDAAHGWRVFRQTGMQQAILSRYQAGSTLIGISAGAVQLGLHAWPEDTPRSEALDDCFQLVPYLIDAHQEADQWRRIKQLLNQLSPTIRGLGIPSGGGLAYHPNHSMEAIRKPLCEFIGNEGSIFPEQRFISPL